MSKVIKGSGNIIRGQKSGSYSPPAQTSSATPPPQTSRDVILQHAQREAQLIIQKAQEFVQQAYNEGFQQGYEEAIQHHRQMIERLSNENSEKFQYFEGDLVRLALRVAERVIVAQFEKDPNTITRIVANALGAVRHQREIYIRVNPQDFEIVKKNRSYLLEQLSRAREIDIRPDPEISRGGCLIESEAGVIEASIEKQLQNLENILLGNIKKWGFVPPNEKLKA